MYLQNSYFFCKFNFASFITIFKSIYILHVYCCQICFVRATLMYMYTITITYKFIWNVSVPHTFTYAYEWGKIVQPLLFGCHWHTHNNRSCFASNKDVAVAHYTFRTSFFRMTYCTRNLVYGNVCERVHLYRIHLHLNDVSTTQHNQTELCTWISSRCQFVWWDGERVKISLHVLLRRKPRECR